MFNKVHIYVKYTFIVECQIYILFVFLYLHDMFFYVFAKDKKVNVYFCFLCLQIFKLKCRFK